MVRFAEVERVEVWDRWQAGETTRSTGVDTTTGVEERKGASKLDVLGRNCSRPLSARLAGWAGSAWLVPSNSLPAFQLSSGHSFGRWRSVGAAPAISLIVHQRSKRLETQVSNSEPRNYADVVLVSSTLTGPRARGLVVLSTKVVDGMR